MPVDGAEPLRSVSSECVAGRTATPQSGPMPYPSPWPLVLPCCRGRCIGRCSRWRLSGPTLRYDPTRSVYGVYRPLSRSRRAGAPSTCSGISRGGARCPSRRGAPRGRSEQVRAAPWCADSRVARGVMVGYGRGVTRWVSSRGGGCAELWLLGGGSPLSASRGGVPAGCQGAPAPFRLGSGRLGGVLARHSRGPKGTRVRDFCRAS